MASSDKLTQTFENSVAAATNMPIDHRPIDEIVHEFAAVLRPAPEGPVGLH